MENEPGVLEKQAHLLLAQEKASEAYVLFREAGDIYKERGQHKEAALCLASAASCWAMKSGEKAFHNASLAYVEAARESELAGDLEYASLLYRQAAINFERDLESLSFSECFYLSRECLRKFFTRSLIAPQKIRRIGTSGIKNGGFFGVIRGLFLGLSLTFSALIWGHGERPQRTFYTALFLIFLSALFYMQGSLVANGVEFRPDFFSALYFSVVTFSTVGYGDITPIGLTKLAAMFEVFCGIFIIPLFIVGLSRKYLRI